MKTDKEIIASLSNKKIKNISLLMRKQTERKAQGLAVVEGEKEIAQALAGNAKIDSIFICSEIAKNKNIIDDCIQNCPADHVFFISKEVFAKIAYRDDSGGIILVVKTKYFSLDDISLPKNPLIIVLEKVEKPGNLGAVLRTCDAAAVDLLIICDAETDIYNPNVIRSGIGCVFTQKIAVCSSEEAISWLRNKNIRIICAALQSENLYSNFDFTCPSAVVFGSEDKGLTEKWILAADSLIKIPMFGHIDSLNVSNSVAIIIYEAKRQRGF